MTVDQIVALLASIAAFMSAIAAFVVVRQNAQQIRASLKPELVILRCSFEVKKSNPDDPVATIWRVAKPASLSAEPNIDDQFDWASVRLQNVGREAARDVTISWNYALNEWVGKINELVRKSDRPGWSFGTLGSMLSLNDNASTAWAVTTRGSDYLDFILPSSVEPLGTSIRLPLAFQRLVAAHAFLVANELSEFDATPSLALQLNYTDIGGTKHSEQFRLQFSYVTLHGGGDQFWIEVKPARER